MNHMAQIEKKIFDRTSLAKQTSQWRAQKQKVVFTNGCFDILHYGHLYYLAQAASLGQKLIVGMNSTESVQRLKGAHRPIQDEKTRLTLMASLSYVDAVCFFKEDTPYELIKAAQPDVLVKGGDWKIEQIVGSDIVIKSGGEVKSLAFVEGFSTTAIETKIIESSQKK